MTTVPYDPYFHPVGPGRFTPTHHVAGAWSTDEQHIAPMFGLLAHLVDADRIARGRAHLALGRASFDILGVLAMDAFEVQVTVVRPGRTIELVEARVVQGGRDAVLARCWLMQAGDTGSLAGSPFAPMPPRAAMAPFDRPDRPCVP